jgi:hypothetical protein
MPVPGEVASVEKKDLRKKNIFVERSNFMIF